MLFQSNFANKDHLLKFMHLMWKYHNMYTLICFGIAIFDLFLNLHLSYLLFILSTMADLNHCILEKTQGWSSFLHWWILVTIIHGTDSSMKRELQSENKPKFGSHHNGKWRHCLVEMHGDDTTPRWFLWSKRTLTPQCIDNAKELWDDLQIIQRS